MNQKQITKATDKLLVNRYKWLVSRLDKINPVLSAHNNGTTKIENRHHFNKMNKERDRIFDEMERIEMEMNLRRQKEKKEQESAPELQKV